MTYICYAKRTPIAKLSGAFSETPAPKLASVLITDAIKETKIAKEAVEEIILGQVLSAGCGQAPTRQAAIYGGLSPATRATGINRVCGSGLKAVMLGNNLIQLDEAQVVFAGGMENMTLAPHLLSNSRKGYRFGSIEAKDHMQYDGLTDPYELKAMGYYAEMCAKSYGFTREQQDDFAKESYLRARAAWQDGIYAKEVVPVEILDKKNKKMITQDEEPFNADLERLASLKPAFTEQGTITAASSSSINDGAAMAVLASESAVSKYNLSPKARIISQCSFAHDPKWFTTAPISCIKTLLSKAGRKLEDIDIFEINEAFAVVTMAACKDLALSAKKVNPFGGAVAMGHPIGASGARILVTLVTALHHFNKKLGVAAICIGGGEASAILLERC